MHSWLPFQSAQFFRTTSQTLVIVHHLRTISKKPILGGMNIYFIPFPSENSRHTNPNRSPGDFIDSSLNQTQASIFLKSQKPVLMLFKKVVPKDAMTPDLLTLCPWIFNTECRLLPTVCM